MRWIQAVLSHSFIVVRILSDIFLSPAQSRSFRLRKIVLVAMLTTKITKVGNMPLNMERIIHGY